MNENRRQILNMLADNKITAEEAERLLAALESNGSPSAKGSNATNSDGSRPEASKGHAKYIRVMVEAKQGAEDRDGNPSAIAPTTVNIRVPVQLLRAGVRLASLIPAQAHQHLDAALSQHGVPLTLSQIKPENLEELIDHLDDLTIDVAANEKHSNVKVRVFSE